MNELSYPEELVKIVASQGAITREQVQRLIRQLCPTPLVQGWDVERSMELDDQSKANICVNSLHIASQLLKEGRLSSLLHADIERAVFCTLDGLAGRSCEADKPATLELHFYGVSFQETPFSGPLQLKSLTFSNCEFSRGLVLQAVEVEETVIFCRCTSPRFADVYISMFQDANHELGPDWRPSIFFAYCSIYGLNIQRSTVFAFLFHSRLERLTATLSPPSILQKVDCLVGREYVVIEDWDKPRYDMPVAGWWDDRRGWSLRSP